MAKPSRVRRFLRWLVAAEQLESTMKRSVVFLIGMVVLVMLLILVLALRPAGYG